MNVVEMAWRGTRHIRYMLGARPAQRRGVPLVRVLCDVCDTRAAVIEDHGQQRMILAGRRRYTFARLDLVACPRHGQLTTGWASWVRRWTGPGRNTAPSRSAQSRIACRRLFRKLGAGHDRAAPRNPPCHLRVR